VAEAARDVEAALTDDPADPAAHTLAGLIADVGGRTESAADAFRAALYLEPNLVQVRLLLAGCLRRMGEAELAGRQYREIVTTLERGAARRLPALDGRLLPDPQETLRRARQSLAAARGE
jgi:tetratricopeptide (TPR) repeat protein